MQCGFGRARSRLTPEFAMSSFEAFIDEVKELQAYVVQMEEIPSMAGNVEGAKSAHSNTVLTKIASMPSMTLTEAMQLTSLVKDGPWTVPLRCSINPLYVSLVAFVSIFLG